MKHLALIAAIIILLTVSASADVPNQIPYQGYMTDSTGVPLDGVYTLTFSIYDISSGGTPYWSSGPQFLVVSGGRLTYEMGSSVPFPDSLFDSSPRFLGITIDPDPELKPRTEISSAMFAQRASRADSADGISKDRLIMTGVSGDTVKVQSDRIQLVDGFNGLRKVWIGPADFGLGGSLRLYNTSAGPPSPNPVEIDGRVTGDNAVLFREGSINSFEMWNEPGLAHNEASVSSQALGATMQDLVTVSIDLPEDGYVFLIGRCYAGVTGTTSSEGGYFQIDDGGGGGLESPYYTFAGANGFPSASVTTWWPVTTQRVFYRSAGTHTFRLEGERWQSNGTVSIWNPILTAIYLPTAYGTVTGTISANDAGEFESKTAVNIPTDEEQGLSERNLVKVNLAELEHRATKARLKALQAELDAREVKERLQKAREKEEAKK